MKISSSVFYSSLIHASLFLVLRWCQSAVILILVLCQTVFSFFLRSTFCWLFMTFRILKSSDFWATNNFVSYTPGIIVKQHALVVFSGFWQVAADVACQENGILLSQRSSYNYVFLNKIKLFLKEHSSLNLVLIFNEIMVIKLYIYFLGNDQLVLHLKIVCLPAMMCVNFATAKYLQKRLRHIIVWSIIYIY